MPASNKHTTKLLTRDQNNSDKEATKKNYDIIQPSQTCNRHNDGSREDTNHAIKIVKKEKKKYEYTHSDIPYKTTRRLAQESKPALPYLKGRKDMCFIKHSQVKSSFHLQGLVSTRGKPRAVL